MHLKMIDFPDADETARRLAERYGPKRVLPISISIPEELIVAKVPEKTQDFGNRVNIGHGYQFSLDQEAQYYANYKRSSLSLTSRKGGWDCLRHLEILASGCIPYMPDIDDCPPLTMTHYPRALISKARFLYKGQVKQTTDGSLEAMRKPVIEDQATYNDIAGRLLAHTQKCLSTSALARWTLDITGHSNARSILFLTDAAKISYVSVMLYHGLRSILGRGVTDYQRMWYMYDSAPLRKRGRLYGRGFTYSGRLPDLEVNRKAIRSRIKNREFDVIVFGLVSHSNSLLPLVRRYYDQEEILLIDGGDSMLFPGIPKFGRVKGSLLRKLQIPDRNLIRNGIVLKREINDETLAMLDTVL